MIINNDHVIPMTVDSDHVIPLTANDDHVIPLSVEDSFMRQFSEAKREVDGWPQWMKDLAYVGSASAVLPPR